MRTGLRYRYAFLLAAVSRRPVEEVQHYQADWTRMEEFQLGFHIAQFI